MSCVTKVAASAETGPSVRKPFATRQRLPKASPETVTRQAQITLLAFKAHDRRDDALAFLNGPSDVLQGRPIDIAGATDAGLAAATSLLAASRP